MIVLFFIILLVGFSGCSAMTAQEARTRELSGEANTREMGENVDSAITARVKAAISEEPLLKDEGITVKTSDGAVSLTGSVSSILVMEKAIEVAHGVRGVREVKDEMQFRWQN